MWPRLLPVFSPKPKSNGKCQPTKEEEKSKIKSVFIPQPTRMPSIINVSNIWRQMLVPRRPRNLLEFQPLFGNNILVHSAKMENISICSIQLYSHHHHHRAPRVQITANSVWRTLREFPVDKVGGTRPLALLFLWPLVSLSLTFGQISWWRQSSALTGTIWCRAHTIKNAHKRGTGTNSGPRATKKNHK